jgi:hypothetical protein
MRVLGNGAIEIAHGLRGVFGEQRDAHQKKGWWRPPASRGVWLGRRSRDHPSNP